MNDKEIKKKINLDCALKGKLIKKLKDILKLYDKEWLEEYYYTITKEQFNGSKQSMINKIYDELTDENIIHRFLNTLMENEYLELIRIIQNNGELQDDYIEHISYNYLKNFGIVYTFNYKNNLYIIIPEEIMDAIKNMNINRYRDKTIENSKLVNLANSMLNLYGVVPLNIFLDACCKYYNYSNFEEVDLNCIFIPERTNAIRIIQTDENMYMLKADDEDNCDKAIITKIISRIEDDLFYFDFKEIELDDLLKYNDLYYYEETDAVIEFKEYLRDNNMSDENIELLVGTIIECFRKDYNEATLFLNDIFIDEEWEITDENIDEIMSYVNKIVNNISMWGNKGWTNKEIILGKCYE